MADVAPLPGIVFAGGVSAAGQTTAFDLPGTPHQVTCGCIVTGLTAGGSVTVALQMATGDPTQAANWTTVATLPAQSATGSQAASRPLAHNRMGKAEARTSFVAVQASAKAGFDSSERK